MYCWCSGVWCFCWVESSEVIGEFLCGVERVWWDGGCGFGCLMVVDLVNHDALLCQYCLFWCCFW